MAFNNSGFGVPHSGSVFGGYAGGYTQTPEGIILHPNTNALGVGFPPIPGANLPSVDPYAFPGAVHFGPSTITGPQAAELPINAAGYVDPNLMLGGAANYNAGI